MSIVIENLSKSYGPVRALQNVSCTWEPGKLYGLLGRNGAGKSTLLSAVTQRLFPDGGSVTVDGEPIGDNDRALSKMYLMSEKLYYPETMRVKDAFRWSQAFYPNFDREFAWNLAGAFQLNTSAKVSKLSSGYSSIFKIVVALSTNAPYVLLDEPVLGLDANHRDLFYKTLLARYAERPFTAVISTHLIEEISHLIEDVVILHHGQVLAQGPREELLAGGYTVSGPKGLVEEYIRGKRLLGVDTTVLATLIDLLNLPIWRGSSNMFLSLFDLEGMGFGATFVNTLFSFPFSFVLLALLMTLGYFLVVFFYRLPVKLRIVVGACAGFLLFFGVPGLQLVNDALGYPFSYIAEHYLWPLEDAIVASPLLTMGTWAVAAVALAAVTWLILRRTTVAR